MRSKKQEGDHEMIFGELITQNSDGKSVPGKSVSIQLYSSTKVDPSTGKGRLSKKANLKQGKSITDKIRGIKTTSYRFRIAVNPDFGLPGAFVVKNQHKHEFYLQSLVLQAQDDTLIHFECNSWIYPSQLTQVDRVFFSNNCYLPNETPNGLLELRKEELLSLRGDGTGQIEEWDRIYDYGKYDDLGDPARGPKYVRPVLGGSDVYPYPRRAKTSHTDSNNGSRSNGLEKTNQKGVFDIEITVPPDERFSPEKLSELTKNSIQAALHFVVSQGKSDFRDFKDTRPFHSFVEMYGLFRRYKSHEVDEWAIKKLRTLVPDELFKKIKRAIKEYTVRFPLPQIIRGDEFAWKEDEEFARQMLAGTNATVIQCLQKFPPESSKGVVSSIKLSRIKHNLDGLTLQEAMNQWRIFILDHHDYLMPFLERVSQHGICAYASRTLLFLKDDGTLKPLAIELCFPNSSSGSESEIQRVFYPKAEESEAAIWHLAKSHVAANDSGYHLLITHWLKTHAVVEPFIVATRRQLSRMHPVHRLLEPHFKDTMHINALYRKVVMNAGGILEKTLFTGEVSMEISSALYKHWRFDEQSLPADLVKRGMAIYNPEHPAGVQLVIEDYPYGADGLEIWVAIKKWVADFCSHFYHDDESLKSDNEIQEWWSEIRNIGHGDKSTETWWSSMTTLSELIEALTTLIWLSSGFHASVNFGHYGYTGYPPNRATKCRRFIPYEGTTEFGDFLEDPDRYFLGMLPNRFDVTLHMALAEVVSRHASDEVYLGQQQSPDYWMGDEWIQHRFRRFIKELTEVEKRIRERNADLRLSNRWGPAKISYTLLCPDVSNSASGRSLSGRGIPNSISI